ncbi:hypothetical protein [Haladaptatus halobius]|jgi:hypothetical protein|uniref:hypothetical protein n=1 Tax=Haladaptatus halobius TaxID=2884875 RepID=UPI001D0B8EE5|nr:hypothetical protein [Haladaptatus halobius]
MRNLFRIIFGMNMVLLVLLAIAFTAIQPGTGAYVIAVLSLGVILITLLIVSSLLYVDWQGLNPREPR